MMKNIVFTIVFLLQYTFGQDYWKVTNVGFLPKHKGDSCASNELKHLCNVMRTDPSTPNIVEAVSHIKFDQLVSEKESENEDTFHWLSIATCRVGYNQNPTGSDIGTPITIPSEISSRLLFLANHLQREPTTGYASLVLDNCVRQEQLDIDSYENYEIQRTVTSFTEDIAHRAEKGFYASHCAVEYAFGQAIENLLKIGNINDNSNKLTNHLRQLAYNIRKAIPVLKQMRHFFNSEHFFKYLRPYIKCGNIGDNGIVFEGDNTCANILLPNGTTRNIPFGTPIYGFRGPTGAQTSSLSAIDSALQITTSISTDPNLELTMKEFRQYHPIEHYKLNDMLGNIKLRERVLQFNDHMLTDAYNDAVTAVAEFRFAHVDHVMTYIFKSIPHVHAKYVTGTGNTPIATYLCKSAVGTLMSRIVENASTNLPTVSIPSICFHECASKTLDTHDENYCELFNKII